MTLRSPLAFALAFLFAPIARAQGPLVPIEEALLEDPSPTIDQHMGWSVDLSGDHAVIGGPPALGSPPYGPGSAQVFVREPSGWEFVAELDPGGAPLSGSYAWSVAIDGDRIVVGDPGASSVGRALVFERSASGFVLQAELVPTPGPSTGPVHGFGLSVSLDGDTLAVAASSGPVYVFRLQAGAWVQELEFVTVGASTWGEVALDGDTLLAFGGDRVHVLVHQGGSWSRQAALRPRNPINGSGFGQSFALDGDSAIVGAPFGHPSLGNGTAHVFERVGTSWSETAVLRPTDIETTCCSPTPQFGMSVAIDGELCAVGMSGVDGVHAPSVYVFRRAAGAWTRQARFNGATTQSFDGFGNSEIALEEGRVVVGACNRYVAGVNRAGAAHVFRLTDGVGLALCHGTGCPCANDDAAAGCANSTGAGAALSGSGSNGIVADDLVLSASGLPSLASGVLVAGDDWTRVPFGDGLRCVAGSLVRLAIVQADAAGASDVGPGLASTLGLAPGDTRTFQAWYRDPAGPCGSGFDLSNAYEVVFGL